MIQRVNKSYNNIEINFRLQLDQNFSTAGNAAILVLRPKYIRFSKYV